MSQLSEGLDELVAQVADGKLDPGHPGRHRLTRPSSRARLGPVTIPRILVGLYQVRNNRGVAHVGGDVGANPMDASYVLHATQWVMAELVRIFHDTDTGTAAKVVDALADRTLPIIWEVRETRRLLDTSLNLADATLLLLYDTPDGATDRALARDLEQKRLDNYRRVLRRLHDDRLIEYPGPNARAVISPKGSKQIEEQSLLAL